jgi:hypothetical protein
MKQITTGLVLAVVFLVGCATAEPTATPMPTHTPQPTATSTPTPAPTPTPTTGQVKGTLIDESTGQARGAKVNLVPVIVSDDGTTITYSTDLLKERAMSMDAPSGSFLFENVTPGDYVMTVNIGGGMPLDLTDDQGSRIIVKVEAGKAVDMGDVTVRR